jgi:hypothetical protein
MFWHFATFDSVEFDVASLTRKFLICLTKQIKPDIVKKFLFAL